MSNAVYFKSKHEYTQFLINPSQWLDKRIKEENKDTIRKRRGGTGGRGA